MKTYKSQRQRIDCHIQTIYDKLSTPEVFEQLVRDNIDRVPESAREQVGKLQFGPDSIAMETPIGPMHLRLSKERSVSPTTVVYGVEQSPVDFELTVNLSDNGDNTTDCEAALSINLPFFLRGMVGKYIEDGAEQFGRLLTQLPWQSL